MAMMMVFSVFDHAVGAYLPPFFERSRAAALRAFRTACEDDKHQFHKHANDYSLWYVGTFSEDDGALIAAEAREKLAQAADFVPPG